MRQHRHRIEHDCVLGLGGDAGIDDRHAGSGPANRPPAGSRRCSPPARACSSGRCSAWNKVAPRSSPAIAVPSDRPTSIAAIAVPCAVSVVGALPEVKLRLTMSAPRRAGCARSTELSMAPMRMPAPAFAPIGLPADGFQYPPTVAELAAAGVRIGREVERIVERDDRRRKFSAQPSQRIDRRDTARRRRHHQRQSQRIEALDAFEAKPLLIRCPQGNQRDWRSGCVPAARRPRSGRQRPGPAANAASARNMTKVIRPAAITWIHHPIQVQQWHFSHGNQPRVKRVVRHGGFPPRRQFLRDITSRSPKCTGMFWIPPAIWLATRGDSARLGAVLRAEQKLLTPVP